MECVRDLPHTADIGFEVRADGLSRLFELAVGGLLNALGAGAAGGRGASRRPEETLRLQRPDLERLFVAWLRELLHRITAERALPESVRAEVRASPDRDASLEARIRWVPWTAATAPGREIKGVTYHGLRVEERDGAWHARVVLDV